MRSHVAQAVASPAKSLTIWGGDFNWVSEVDDRRSFSGFASGGRDQSEEAHFRILLRTVSLEDQVQPDPTFRGGTAESRLDRIYHNAHASFQLDREVSCHVLDWTDGVSDHRPLLHYRVSSLSARFSVADSFLGIRPSRMSYSPPIRGRALSWVSHGSRA